MHILSPETDNCPSWISGRERMTVVVVVVAVVVEVIYLFKCHTSCMLHCYTFCLNMRIIQFMYIHLSPFTCPASILYKSIAGRYRPVRVADGPTTARYWFIKNSYWVATWVMLPCKCIAINKVIWFDWFDVQWSIRSFTFNSQFTVWKITGTNWWHDCSRPSLFICGNL